MSFVRQKERKTMSLLSRLKGLLQIQRLEQDLDDELLSHVKMRAEENLAAGM